MKGRSYLILGQVVVSPSVMSHKDAKHLIFRFVIRGICTSLWRALKRHRIMLELNALKPEE